MLGREIIDKLKYYWFILMVILVPCVYPPTGGQMRPFQEHFFQWMSIGLVALFLENIWLTMFLIYNVIVYLWAGGLVGSMQVLNILFGCLIFRFSRSYFKNHTFEMMYKPILFTLGITLAFTAMQFLHIDMINIPQTGDEHVMNGTMTQPVGIFGICFAHALFLTLCMPILASTFAYGWIVSLCLLPLIYMCKSSAGMLAAICVVAFYVYYRWIMTANSNVRKLYVYGLVLIPILGGAYIYHDYTSDKITMKSRFPMWSATIQASFMHPEGYGPDSFRNYNSKKDFLLHSDINSETMIERKVDANKSMLSYYSASHDIAKVAEMNQSLQTNGFPSDVSGARNFNLWDNCHNLPIQVLFEYGFFGLFLLLGLLRDIHGRFIKSNKSLEVVTIISCLLIFPIGCLTEFPMHLARLAVFFPILLGALYAITEKGATNGYGKK